MVCDVGRYMQGGYVSNSTSEVRYSADLTLVPVRSVLGDWFGDYTAVSKAVEAMGAPLSRPLTSRGDAAAFAASAAYAGRIRHMSPHCSRHGVVCNSMGRVVHFDAAVAATPEPPGGAADTSTQPVPNAAAALRGIVAMPWLVSVNFGDAGVSGRVPSAAELEWQPAMVRRCPCVVSRSPPLGVNASPQRLLSAEDGTA